MNVKTKEATIADLYTVPEDGKAEIVNGELVLMSPTGGLPSRAGGKIYLRLAEYERQSGGGYAFGDNTSFIVDWPCRAGKCLSMSYCNHPVSYR